MMVEAERLAAPPVVTTAIEAFLSTLGGKSPQTLRTYRTSLGRFSEFLEEEGLAPQVVPTDALPATILERYYAWLVASYGRGRRATVTTYLAGVRAFVAYLDRHRWLAPETSSEQMRDLLRQVVGKGSYKTPRVDRALPLVVVEAEQAIVPPPVAGALNALASAGVAASEAGAAKGRAGRPLADGDRRRLQLELLRDRAILHTLFATGVRREEASRLNRQDLDDGWSAQALITGKGNKERVIFFSEEALQAIRAYLEARADRYDPLFLRHDKRRGAPKPRGENYRLSPLGIWRVVKQYAARAGVDASPHDFRHAKASTLLNRGAKLSEVQDILGHASPETTKKIYAHYETAHLRDAFDRYSATVGELAADARAARRRRSTAASIAPPSTNDPDAL